MSEFSLESAARFCSHPLWSEAVWLGTTFKLAPNNDAPPVMAIMFGDYRLGVNLFRIWVDDWGNFDENNAIRISLVEGDIASQDSGYSVHISPQDVTAGYGQWQRMYPLGLFPDMLEPFKASFEKHQEFMLAPVVRHDDNLAYVNANAGIISRDLKLRDASEICEGDIDEVLLRSPSSGTLT